MKAISVIRKYEANDVEAVLETWEAASKVGHPFVDEKFLATERYNIPNVYLPNAETWVWESEEQVVGFIALIGDEVGAIFIRPEHHRKGIGWALMDHARSLRDNLELQVFEANTVGRRFYEKYGFRLMHSLTDEQTGLPMLRLKLAQDSPIEG